ncbi:uncharacterized protein LOC130991314 isoform X2 [Salvia miltiorrhiza]|uniref:uncharacterized protein LOC130991314 isoform X2 n=1 Tax=Salvia miltiorrhiza TaxID=226208 RepID=UPI0025AC0667|nr:uncharacterized protein LOC130991314 isoform X2 [Salvia miltiorrhiza]
MKLVCNFPQLSETFCFCLESGAFSLEACSYIASEQGETITFADVAGVDEAKEELEEIVIFLLISSNTVDRRRKRRQWRCEIKLVETMEIVSYTYQRFVFIDSLVDETCKLAEHY